MSLPSLRLFMARGYVLKYVPNTLFGIKKYGPDISVQMQKGIKRYSKGKYVGENKYYFKQ